MIAKAFTAQHIKVFAIMVLAEGTADPVTSCVDCISPCHPVIPSYRASLKRPASPAPCLPRSDGFS